ncbi:MAG: hypothetical protein RL550_1008 [Actinomycetota bacterium]
MTIGFVQPGTRRGMLLQMIEVVVLEIHVEIRKDQTVLNELPDDPGHLVTVEFDDRVVDLDLRHVGATFRTRGPATCLGLVL